MGYCGMLPVRAARDYALYSLPRRKLIEGEGEKGEGREAADGPPRIDPERARRIVDAKMEELARRKLEAYRTGRTGDHRPDVEEWHAHQRRTMWNADRDELRGGSPRRPRPIPPRVLQRPHFRRGAPALTARQAELYGLLPYRRPPDGDGEARRRDVERAVVRGVRFAEGVHEGRTADGARVGPWTVKDGKFSAEGEDPSIDGDAVPGDAPLCLAATEVLAPRAADGTPVGLPGQDKFLGGVASPCGRYVYGVPGHARQVRTSARGRLTLSASRTTGSSSGCTGWRSRAARWGRTGMGASPAPRGAASPYPAAAATGGSSKSTPRRPACRLF